jgi:taurine dioxygenase
MRWFGPFEFHAFAKPHPEHPEMIVLYQTTPQTDGANNWHTDSSFMEHPALGSMLRAVRLPAIGGDTCWASMYAAYEALSPRLRDMLDGMTAMHDLTATLRKAIAGGHATSEDLVRFQKEWPPVEHPVIRTHPWTGRRALYVNSNFTTRLCGLEQAESDTLLEFLLRHLQRPDFQVRFTWDEKTVALWDNRCTQHYAIADYTGQRRVMNRVTVEGERPYFDPSLGTELGTRELNRMKRHGEDGLPIRTPSPDLRSFQPRNLRDRRSVGVEFYAAFRASVGIRAEIVTQSPGSRGIGPNSTIHLRCLYSVPISDVHAPRGRRRVG